MKSTSSAIWWIKSPKKTSKRAIKKRKQSVGARFSNDMTDLFRNISMHAYGKLVDSTLNVWEKLIWLAVHLTTMFTLFTILSLIWEQFVAQYIVINLSNPLYPIEYVPFPSISICSNNRISRQAALAYAKQLSEKDFQGRSVDFFMEHLRFFIQFYQKIDLDVDAEEFSNFQALLDKYDIYENDTFYDTRRVAEMLTPSCESLIRNCKLSGVEVECFSRKTFQKSLTTYGFCCTFNTGNFYNNRKMRDQFVSTELGLTVVLNTSHKDDFMSLMNIDGYIVIVHDSDIFADTTSGESHELFITYGEESFLALNALLVYTEPNLSSFSPHTRKCYFEDEFSLYPTSLQWNYSFSNCVTRCRIRSILSLCSCIPFYMDTRLVSDRDGVIYCTLQHVPCLLSYKFKWNNVLTHREFVPGLQRAYEEALYCPECLPACNDIQYGVSFMALPIDRFLATTTKDELDKVALDLEEMSVLRIHFDEPYAKYYKRVVGNTWYEALCTIGNVTSIFLGFSIVAGFEIGFFTTKYVILAIRSAISQKHKEDKKKDEIQLYICP
ncbi:PREDICTED: sodium channel protein Nach [Bactrocera latifrons]|uniref:sodium channel protein Nach n=1 Tax=Bactrocera latifrons TaxID=174628 RepID=UPI0008DD96EE|nr:PREDICTED: sodium channel protein Nach [Bactrocera latifrons]